MVLPKFEVVQINSEETVGTFHFFKEDHTLANVLRSQILENPKVNFCGYSIPHPSEEYFQLQIQTIDNYNVYEALLHAFEDLISICDRTEHLFNEAVDASKCKEEMETD